MNMKALKGIFVALTLGAFILGGCSNALEKLGLKDEDDDTVTLAAPTYDATGRWRVTLANGTATGCSATPYTVEYGNVTQTGNNMTGFYKGESYTGVVSGSKYSYSGSIPQDGGTLNLRVDFTLSSENSGSGTSTWTWSDGSSSCNGSEDVTVRRVSS